MFDPNIPQAGTEIDAVQMRSQLQGLKALIDAILTVTAAQVDSTATLPADYPAGVSVNVIGNTLHFSFDIPRGADGIPGVQGPPFAQALVNAVNTLDPGMPAAVDVGFDGTNVRFTFDIPRGADGVQGPPFAQAVVDMVNTVDPGMPAAVYVNYDGMYVRFTFDIPRGADGIPGEVTNVDLSDAISGTSSNTNAVNTLDTPFADPDAETLRQAYNALVLAARR